MTSSNFDSLSAWGKFWDIAWHAAAPIFVTTVIDIAGFSRFMRGQMLEFMGQDYIRTAVPRGLSERTVIYKHALRNAVTPFIAGIGGTLPALIAGAGFVEFTLNWPGITPLLINAINRVDIYLYTASSRCRSCSSSSAT
jgi:peptide/nickel transport system permease protein